MTVSGTLLPEFEGFLEHRRRLGLDVFDEVWDGTLHLNPGPSESHADVQLQVGHVLRPLAAARELRVVGPTNLGRGDDDFRLPDLMLRPVTAARGVFAQDAVLVVEVVSPSDESYRKFDFYRRHEVQEVLVVDPQRRTVELFGYRGDQVVELTRSHVLDVTADHIATGISWP